MTLNSKESITSTDHYLVGLDLRDRKVLVVGGGSVAQRRIPVLVGSGAKVVVVSPEVTPMVEAHPGITLIAREYLTDDLSDAWYVLACTNNPEVNARIVSESTERRIFCVRADLAREGTAVTPASLRRDELAIGVLAGGDHRRSAEIRRAIDAALAAGNLMTEAARRAEKLEKYSGRVALVGGGPGDKDLITVRGRHLLALADVVVADRLGPMELLDELGPHVEIIDAAKVPYGRSMKQEAINNILIEKAKAGQFVVRLKGGDPYIFGRGFEELAACAEAGISVEVVPGITSPIAAPAAAGISVTQRGINHEVIIVSGHVPPRHPDSLTNWPALAQLQGTIVLMMAVARIDEFTQVLLDGGRAADTPVAIIENGTLPQQRRILTTLELAAADALTHKIVPPAIVVIGSVAGIIAGAL